MNRYLTKVPKGQAEQNKRPLACVVQVPVSIAREFAPESSEVRCVKRMPTLSNRRLIGVTAFCLPALVTVAGVSLDRFRLPLDQRYATWIPKVIIGSVLVAAIVPAACILTSSLPLARRIGFTAAMLCLLACECGFALFLGAMMTWRP